jgi:hypothetical protein
VESRVWEAVISLLGLAATTKRILKERRNSAASLKERRNFRNYALNINFSQVFAEDEKLERTAS